MKSPHPQAQTLEKTDNQNTPENNGYPQSDPAPPEPKSVGLLRYMNAPDWLMLAATIPTPGKLCSDLWHEGDLSFLFSDTGAGKTMLGFQISQGIATGVPIDEEFAVTVKPQKVLYCEFELSVKQWEDRYRNKETGIAYDLSSNIIRAELDLTAFDFRKNLQDAIIEHILTVATTEKIKVIIIDNLTFIQDTSDFNTAIKFMQRMNTLKKAHKLSILVLGHTPKRNMKEPIDENSMTGSKKIMDLSDGAFTIGKSAQDIDRRYVKQIKSRWGAIKYHSGNVINCSIHTGNNATYIKTDGYGYENDHLKKIDIYEERNEQIHELRNEGKSQKELAEEFGISERQIRNILKKPDNELPY